MGRTKSSDIFSCSGRSADECVETKRAANREREVWGVTGGKHDRTKKEKNDAERHRPRGELGMHPGLKARALPLMIRML